MPKEPPLYTVTPVCACGCGRPLQPSPQTRKALGVARGEYFKYLRGHGSVRAAKPYWVVDPVTGCWNWQRYKNNGYGVRHINGQPKAVHILHWEEKYGPVPEGLELDHVCRNRGCVNPDHLEPVTHAENMRRAVARLTWDDVRAIRASTLSCSALGKLYGIDGGQISRIRTGKAWKEAA